jgi:(p)ppGpp synthase/HD superfamily hydrolase
MSNKEKLPHITKEEFHKFILESDLDNPELCVDALYFAEKIHKKHKRDSGNSYLTEHILPIAKDVFELTPPNFRNTSLIIAALLHDSIEDSLVATKSKIGSKFGSDVAHFVYKLSKFTSYNYLARFRWYRKFLTANYNRVIINSVWQVRMIKLCDRYNNLFCSYILYPNVREVYRDIDLINETKEIFFGISKDLDDEIGSKTYNHLYTLIVKFENLINATKLKSSTTKGS